MITTAAGMVVAIPALVAYRYFQRRIVDINAQFETEAGLMIQELYDYKLLAEARLPSMDAAISIEKGVDSEKNTLSDALDFEPENMHQSAQKAAVTTS